ncbi:M4 family metallopeptidase [Nonomuraea sp. NPDC049152]|uniref:M4 family metallopeptidase n=1 Tax=Nonomuraea sp. NPDC049152 TaxID=3154350 RepID=UPI0033DD46CC
MSRHFDRMRYHIADDPDAGGRPRPPGAFTGVAPGLEAVAPRFTSNEAAARFYLDHKLAEDASAPGFRAALATESPARVPDLALRSSRQTPASGTTLVRFDQTHARIPIFGSDVLVELDQARELVAMDARLTEVLGAPGAPAIDPSAALARVAEATGAALEEAGTAPPSLTYYLDEAGTWHLAWHLHGLPAVLPEARTSPDGRAGVNGHGMEDPSPRDLDPQVDYLVDAEDGTILYHFGVTPTVDIPTKLRGFDENGTLVDRIWGDKLAGAFALRDKLRNIVTHDLALADLNENPPLPDPVQAADPDLGEKFKGAVSAHANATRVFDFYRSVLSRDSIDDQGMALTSVINCTVGEGPEWRNAAWWKGRMWYGQMRNPAGVLVSTARFLDVIGHELTHGVIESSSGLVYQDQAGALNESFADVFGIAIKNWYEAAAQERTDTWTWELGAGWRPTGEGLRSLSDPAAFGQPAHMRDFVRTRADNGGVHTNSGIPNKAAHLLLTSTTPEGTPVLDARDWLVLVYLAMVRLSRLADFADVPVALRDVAKVYLAGSPRQLEPVLTAITAAYAAVGIE